jgi:hypothetical protein
MYCICSTATYNSLTYILCILIHPENLLVRAEKAIDAQTAHIMSLSAQLQALQAAQAARDEDTDNDDESESGGTTGEYILFNIFVYMRRVYV